MSFRYIARLAYQFGVRAAQGVSRDQGPKCAGDAAKSRVQSSARRFSSSASRDVAGKAATAGADKIKQSEEAFRTVMFLSVWGPG